MEIFNFSESSVLAVLMVLLPLFSFIIVLSGKRGRGAGVAIFNISAVFLIALFLFNRIWNGEPVHEQLNWFSVGNTRFTAGILLNNLSVLMMMLVSGISLLVHIYSLGYMKDDPDIHKYWAYLGLFCSSMLGLVIADNLLLIYLCWELVGFSSYLLIGFWFTKKAASQAAKKAFVMNRIGDLGLLLGIMIMYSQFNTLDLTRLFGENGLFTASEIKDGLWISGSAQMPAVWLPVAGLSFFFGAIAKSAQFPLHTWLPDAMEGPTSVSSLIHAATMVAAGVFLLARVYPVFDPAVLSVITLTGTLTAFMAATIALTQNDIKRILAYSTISQLGFMFIAMGMGAYAESIFHLATHAFFKCLLFLAAGAIIHQLHHLKDKHGLTFDHQDIRFMGGLRKHMPLTCICMCVGAAALAGLPFTSGFLSKDALLIAAFDRASDPAGMGILVPVLMSLTSWLTSFYIARLIFKVFFGQARFTEHKPAINLTDPPRSMSYILLILAFFSSYLFFAFNPFGYSNSWILQGFSAVVMSNDGFHILIPVLINVVSIVLIYFAYRVYAHGKGKLVSDINPVFRFSNRGWYFDELYDYIFIRSIAGLSTISYAIDRHIIDRVVNASADIIRLFAALSEWLDRKIIDGLVNGIGSLARRTGNFTRKSQSGRVQQYLISMLLVLISYFLFVYFI